MTLPLMFVPQPNGRVLAQPAVASNLAAGLLASVDGWNFPLALLRPLEALFDVAKPLGAENFLDGLQADNFLGAGVLPIAGKRKAPLAWIGVDLCNRAQNPFAEVRGGCWVPGHPSIGRGRELLRIIGADDDTGLNELLSEIGFAEKLGRMLYFNFHYDQSSAECERVYVLDAVARRLHGFALPCSALARTWVN
jgi:hypothetical protein